MFTRHGYSYKERNGKMIKVVHAADLHIDAPLSETGRCRKSDLIDDLKTLINFTNQKNADILLIAGDLFDTPYPSEKCALEVISILGDCRGEIFICPGNHDPYISGSVYQKYTFPDNTYIFTSRETTSRPAKCGAVIYGYAFTSSSEKKHILGEVSDKNALNIYCIHADLGVSGGSYAPTTALDIELTGADYVALGHIHKRSEILTAGNTHYAYPGSLCSRDFGECGKKGVIYAEFEVANGEKHGAFQFVPLISRHFEVVDFSLTGITSLTELEEKLTRMIALREYGQNTSLRVIFKGERSSEIIITKEFWENISSALYEAEYEDGSYEMLSEDEIKNDKTVKGELYSVLEEKLKSHNEREKALARLAMRIALSALQNEDVLETVLETEDGYDH